jgi:ribosome-associated protein
VIEITPTLAIDEAEIQEEFMRAAGPGGQNVNKTASAVQLRFDVAHSPSLPDDVRRRLLRLAGNRLTAAGVLVISARHQRTQALNRAEALAQLVALIRQATIPPKPRYKTSPTAGSQGRRLQRKQRRGNLKRSRRSVSPSDDE